ncbi:hypothetical protein APR12_006345 [Nocardia amikacinitolerans]|uniref:hypothetical protein n=1 Tax=Nocardia amikacinitolerans TaxID=756689 RepID=UPI00082F1218|nr:hypothetical protein [Nocardia amikacinitolerans]MCP2320955.1 hypothetical protein [Nocardia amikacinitolerans]
MSKKKNTTTAPTAPAAPAPETTAPAPETGSGVAVVPVLRNDTDRALWAALGTRPGSTTAALADAAGIGASTARRLLTGWETAGAVRSDTDPASSRAAKIWTAGSAAPEPAAPVAAEPEPAIPEPAAPESVSPEPAAPEPAAPEPVSPEPADPAEVAASADRVPDSAPETVVAAPTGDDPATPAPGAPAPAGDAVAADAESSVERLPAGALRGQVEDFLRDHPGEEFSPHQIGKALDRSSGAVHNALVTLTKSGTARQTSTAPKKFTLAS